MKINYNVTSFYYCLMSYISKFTRNIDVYVTHLIHHKIYSFQFPFEIKRSSFYLKILWNTFSLTWKKLLLLVIIYHNLCYCLHINIFPTSPINSNVVIVFRCPRHRTLINSFIGINSRDSWTYAALKLF